MHSLVFSNLLLIHYQALPPQKRSMELQFLNKTVIFIMKASQVIDKIRQY